MLLRALLFCLVFAATGISHAEVVYRSAAQMALGGTMESFSYDINGDGSGDLIGSLRSLITADVPTSGGSNYTSFTGRTGFEFLLSSDPFGFSLLEAGDVVGQQHSPGEWSSTASTAIQFAYNWNRYNPADNGYAGLDDFVREAWIGFRMTVNNQKVYGVLHFDLYMPGIEPGTEIGGFASLLGAYIQTTPGKPLTVEGGFTAVPEPGTVGLIALGAGFVLSLSAVRRKA